MKSLVGEYRLLLMFILSAVIPDVIKRLKLVTGIGMILLHYLVSYSAHLERKYPYFRRNFYIGILLYLTTKSADKMIGQ